MKYCREILVEDEMYRLYEKVRKTNDYMYGVRRIEDDENPFLKGPCLLCISAQHRVDYASKSNFGIAKEGMKMARMRVRGQKNAGFDLKNFPVKFLAVQAEKVVGHKGEDTNAIVNKMRREFIEKYFFPLVEKDGVRVDCEQAMKNMRNVNIMCYCNGTLFAKEIEDALVGRMQELGYSEEECKRIQSQMCMIPISTDRLSGKELSTCVSFKDINDSEVDGDVTRDMKMSVWQSKTGEVVMPNSDTGVAYLFSGDGEHNLKKYAGFGTGKAMGVCLSSAVSRALENSIHNAAGGEFVPVSVDGLTEDFEKIIQGSVAGKSVGTLMGELDEGLTYGGARRISDEEMELLDQLDDVFDSKIVSDKNLESARDKLSATEKVIGLYDRAIEEFCSEMTRDKILMARGFQFMPEVEERIKVAKSDKELVAEAQKALEGKDSSGKVSIRSMVESAIAQGVTAEDIGKLKSDSKEKIEIREVREKGEKLT